MALQHLRSSTADKRPTPASMADGQLALNTNAASPGLFYKTSTGTLIKVGPVHVGTTAPNATPASGGSAGNSIGEQWLDTSGGGYSLKIWDGSAWRSEAGEFVNVNGDTMTGDLVMNNANIVFEGATADAYETTLTVVDPTADRTITLPDVTGTVVTTGDTGSVTSTMIVDGTIVNADVNASAAIAGTKISPAFGSQNVTTTGTATAAALIPSGSSVPTNGVYLPSANNVAISTNGSGRLFVDASGNVEVVSNSNFIRTPFAVTNSGTSGVTLGVAQSFKVFTGSVVDSVGGILGTGSTWAYGTYLANSINVSGNKSGGVGIRSGNSPIVFFTGSSDIDTSTERMRLDSSGRLGLGTSSPSAAIHAERSSDLVLYANRTTTDGEIVRFAVGGTQAFSFETSSTARTINVPSAVNLNFKVNGSDRVSIDSSGRVGIGTTSVSDKLHIGGGNICLSYADGSTGLRNKISWRTESPFFDEAAYIAVNRTGVPGAPADIVLATGGAGTATEKARLTSDGKLLVGTSSQSGGSLLQVNDNRIRIATAKTPASATDTGVAGEICWDANYVYVCTATNTWKRTAISTW